MKFKSRNLRELAEMVIGDAEHFEYRSNQALMMLGHEVFDPETSRRVLVDHAFIVAGGVITKQARNWLGGKLDASKRSQVMFMDRDDILNLFIVCNLPLPESVRQSVLRREDDDIPF
ncbi:hypothetical protein [Lysobacter changpingensis]|uniref:hypothetical protein n=1 Tax=Lysobacter changpingensis TaxID=2792784 RepID=UPI001A8DAE5F|nr:hypothetical protein [Lysobacter changpingensis]